MKVTIKSKDGKAEVFFAETIYSDCGCFDVHLWEETDYKGEKTKEINFWLRDIKKLVIENV